MLPFAELRQVTASPFLQPGAALCVAQRNLLSLAVPPVFDPPCPYDSGLAMRILQETMTGALLRPLTIAPSSPLTQVAGCLLVEGNQAAPA